MFNFKKYTKGAQKCYERYNQDGITGPVADDKSPIAEKHLPHRNGFEGTITEDHLDKDHKWVNSENVQINEKQLNAYNGKYINHRNANDDLIVPPINILVEKIHAKRVASEYNVEKDKNWSISFNDKKQQGSLPRFPKNVSQNNKTIIGDPSRFKGSSDPVQSIHENAEPLTGSITKADINRVATQIKIGGSSDRDVTILAILRLADEERRELSEIEQKTIVDLKIARTKALLQKPC